MIVIAIDAVKCNRVIVKIHETCFGYRKYLPDSEEMYLNQEDILVISIRVFQWQI